jgi:hypothetical protein
MQKIKSFSRAMNWTRAGLLDDGACKVVRDVQKGQRMTIIDIERRIDMSAKPFHGLQVELESHLLSTGRKVRSGGRGRRLVRPHDRRSFVNVEIDVVLAPKETKNYEGDILYFW